MPLIDARCLACGHVAELLRPLAMYPHTPPCPKCDGTTEQIHLPHGTDTSAPAVVVYAAPDGTFRFPGDPSDQSQSAKHYESLGYTRQEYRGFAEVRRLESRVGKQQASEVRQRIERQCEFREYSLKERHAEIRRGLEQGFQLPETDEKGRPTGRMKTVRLGPEARDLMRRVVEKSNAKRGPQSYDTGFHVDAFSNSRGNRDDARQSDGRRFRD